MEREATKVEATVEEMVVVMRMQVKSSVKKRRKKKKRERWWKEKSVVALVGRGVCHKEVATERPAQTVPKYAG